MSSMNHDMKSVVKSAALLCVVVASHTYSLCSLALILQMSDSRIVIIVYIVL